MTIRTNRPSLLLVSGVAVAIGAASARAGPPIAAFYDTPSIDVWNYPFNSTRGYRAAASTFGAIGQESFPNCLGNGLDCTFDQRDAQALVGFDTGAEIPTGLSPCQYLITGAELTIATATADAFVYDPTYDTWDTYLGGPEDGDGRPVELYGVGFRGENPEGEPWTSENYYEGTSANPGPAILPSGQPESDVRFIFPTDFPGGVVRDVSNNVRDMFDPAPFAIGLTNAVAPGQPVPVDTQFSFQLDVASSNVQAYLAENLSVGRVRLMITSLQPAFSDGGPGSGSFASWICKEASFSGGFHGRLSLTVELLPQGDANRDGLVDFADVTLVLGQWLATGAPGIPGDANCDGLVNFSDLTAILNNWLGAAPSSN